MKKILVFFCITLLPISLFGVEEDVLTLTNQMRFKGKIITAKDCKVKFKAEGNAYWIPAAAIYSIEFANPEDDVYLEYIQQESANKCFSGNTDAELYHGKAGFHVAMGVLFGPFALIGAAVASPTPQSGKTTMFMSENKEFFNDPEYLTCYQKKARGKNVVNTIYGWAAWILVVIVASASTY